MSTRHFYDDPFTLLHTAIANATRPVTFDVEDITDLDGSELSADFDIRIDGELLKVTAVTLDGGGAGIDRWTASHAGGVAAGAHKVGAQVDVVLTKNGLTIGLLDYFVGSPTSPSEGDLLYYHSGAWSRLAVGTNGYLLKSNGTDPGWAADTDVPLATFTTAGDIIYATAASTVTRLGIGADGKSLIVDPGSHLPAWADSFLKLSTVTTAGDLIYASAASTFARLALGTNEYVLTVDTATSLPKWKIAPGAGSMSNPMTAQGDIIYSSDGAGTPARLALGTNEYVLTVDTATSLPKWKVATGGGSTPTSMAALAARDGATSYWKFIASPFSGTDAALTDNPLTAVNNGCTASNTGGPFSGHVAFDGIDDYIAFSTAIPIPAVRGPITFEWWIKPTATNPIGLIDTNPNGGGTFRNYNNRQFEKQAGSNLDFGALSTANWQLLTVVIYTNTGADDWLVYVNGVVTAHATIVNIGNFTWGTGWVLGNINGGGAGWFDGKICHFQIYAGRALTKQQILDHYNATAD